MYFQNKLGKVQWTVYADINKCTQTKTIYI